MMDRVPYLNFQDYLKNLAVHSGGDTADYGLYLNEIASLHRFAFYSSTLVFLIDYKTMTYPFMDTNVLQILGHHLNAFKEGGLEFSFHNNLDFTYLNQDIFKDRATFLAEHRNEDLSRFRFSMGFRYRNAKGRIRHILQRNIITELTSDALPIGIMGFAWDVTNQAPRARIFHEIEWFDEQDQSWKTAVTKEYFPEIDEDKLLSKRELEILKWAMEGLASKQIADRLFISVHTVNAHRKNMLRRTNSRNMIEVAQYALKHRLF